MGGVEQSRRDDLESIGYVLVYFLKGGLPWQGLKAKSATKKYKLIMEKKQSITIPALCQGCPSQFAEYLAYCRSLKFEAKPNIAYLRGMFRDLFRTQGYTNNGSTMEWDWNRIDSGSSGGDRQNGAPDGGMHGYVDNMGGMDSGKKGILDFVPPKTGMDARRSSRGINESFRAASRGKSINSAYFEE